MKGFFSTALLFCEAITGSVQGILVQLRTASWRLPAMRIRILVVHILDPRETGKIDHAFWLLKSQRERSVVILADQRSLWTLPSARFGFSIGRKRIAHALSTKSSKLGSCCYGVLSSTSPPRPTSASWIYFVATIEEILPNPSQILVSTWVICSSRPRLLVVSDSCSLSTALSHP